MPFDGEDSDHLKVYNGNMPGIKTFCVPTLAAHHSMAEAQPHQWENRLGVFRQALQIGVEDIA